MNERKVNVMSIRQIAKHLGISPAYLSYMVNGKRPWRQDLHERYQTLVNSGSVNSFVNNRGLGGVSPDAARHRSPALRSLGLDTPSAEGGVVELRGFEPLTPCVQSRCSPN